MKMVSAAKYNRAERELKPARAYGQGAQGKLLVVKKS
jgi:F-type H+-transporting ATPase subunit gamma